MRIFTPNELARRAGNKYLSVLKDRQPLFRILIKNSFFPVA